MTDHFQLTHENRVTTYRFTRDEKKNAITQDMYAALANAIIAYGEDDSARAFVISGSGDYFTSGNDLQDFASGSRGDEEPPVSRFLKAISHCPKPVIAMVNGPAIGVGLTMLLHCDLVYVSERATLSAPFVGLGLVPEAASSMLLPAAVGMAVANDIFLTGRTLSADEAVKFGLAARAFSAAELEEKVLEIAQQVANSAPNAMKRSKALIRFQKEQVASHMQKEGAVFADQLKSPDFAESVAAKMQKRDPVFA